MPDFDDAVKSINDLAASGHTVIEYVLCNRCKKDFLKSKMTFIALGISSGYYCGSCSTKTKLEKDMESCTNCFISYPKEQMFRKVYSDKYYCNLCWDKLLNNSTETHSTGAKREAPKRDYYSIYSGFLDRLADICQQGLEHYGRDNWRKGLPVENTYDHMLAHLMAWKLSKENKTDEAEDNLAKVAWGCMCLIYENDVERGIVSRP